MLGLSTDPVEIFIPLKMNAKLKFKALVSTKGKEEEELILFQHLLTGRMNLENSWKLFWAIQNGRHRFWKIEKTKASNFDLD